MVGGAWALAEQLAHQACAATQHFELQHVALWGEACAPYERARAQVLLARALDRAGQPEAGIHERNTARVCFERLGARLDVEALTEPVTVG